MYVDLSLYLVVGLYEVQVFRYVWSSCMYVGFNVVILIYLSVRKSVNLNIGRLNVHFVCQLVDSYRSCVCRNVCRSDVCMHVCLSVGRSVCMFVCLFIDVNHVCKVN